MHSCFSRRTYSRDSTVCIPCRRCEAVGSLMSAIYSTLPIFRVVRFYLLIVLSHAVTREVKKKRKGRVIYCIFSCFIPRAVENGCPITRQVVSFSFPRPALLWVISSSALWCVGYSRFHALLDTWKTQPQKIESQGKHGHYLLFASFCSSLVKNLTDKARLLGTPLDTAEFRAILYVFRDRHVSDCFSLCYGIVTKMNVVFTTSPHKWRQYQKN